MSEKQEIALFRVLGTQCDRKLQKLIKMNDFFLKHLLQQEVPSGLMARIAGFHPAGPGSIPGVGEFIFKSYFHQLIFFKVKSIWFIQVDSFYTYF